MKWALVLVFRVAKFIFKIPLIAVLLLFGRGSLALHVWGRGRLNRWVAHLYDADKDMYRRERWKATRRIVYARNKRENGGVFRCAATGKRIDSLGQAHVDHILSRAGFPMLAYRLDNLRLVLDSVNIAKSDRLPLLFFIKFALTNRIR